MVGPSLLPLEYKALPVFGIIRPPVKILVAGLSPQPVVKPTEYCSPRLFCQPFKNVLRVDTPIAGTLEERKAAAVIGMQAANQGD